MPTPLMRTFAKEAGKKTKTVEKMWKKAEETVKSTYDIDEESTRFYPLVVGILKNQLGIRKKEIIKEDGDGAVVGDAGGMDTTSMGDYQFAPKLGQIITFPPNYVSSFVTAKDYTKKIKKIKKKIKSRKKMNEDFGDVFDSICSDYITRVDDDILVEFVLSAMERYYGLEKSVFDDIKE